jgi:UDP-N-acetylmuramoyl-L-alanyl-D-glutamate--2,6-diaminopimelate ligase
MTDEQDYLPQVITVVGCGGKPMTATKRPIMADIACRFSNRVILTSDNPRNEDPLDILEQMQAGVSPVDVKKTTTIEDRHEAIKRAVSLAQSARYNSYCRKRPRNVSGD